MAAAQSRPRADYQPRNPPGEVRRKQGNRDMSKPILCVDFDGVIHSYTSGWQGATDIPDPPVKGALSWLYTAGEWWDVAIYSSRSKEPGAIKAMQKWLRKHASVEFDGLVPIDDFMAALSFPTQKPVANMTIDDHALCFEGELRFAVGFDPVNGLVRIEFGKPVAWLAMPREHAINMARSLLKQAGAT